MSSLYYKLIPLFVSCLLFVLAFRVHERFWSLGFFGWQKIYLGLAALFLGSLAGVFFEFSELRSWQEMLGLPIDWILLSIFASLGAALILWGAVERLSRAAREKDDLQKQQEAFELFDSIRDAAQGPYSFLEILNFSLREIMRKIDADAGGIWLMHPSSGDFILASASGFALSLQQKLERVPATHAGFSRLVDGRTAREIVDSPSMRHFFPELCSSDDGYDSLLGVPLLGGYGRARHREPLGLLLFCARGKEFLHLADTKLIGSAVAFVAATIAGVRASRMLRNQRQASDRLRAAEREFSLWVQAWAAEKGARRRLQAAISRLAERAGDFVGCGRYLLKENRWEPLALAVMVADEYLIGEEGFRRAAAEAIQTGEETTYELPAAERREGKAFAYRMVPVGNPDPPDRYSAVLFLPAVRDLPSWWEQAISTVAELTRVVLAIEDAKPQKLASASLARSEPALNWAGLRQIVERKLREKPAELPRLLAKVLPDGRRMALWQSAPGNRSEYHLRLAAAKGGKGIYYSPEELASAPVADQVEINAHLGGLVRADYTSTGVLTEFWPDFGSGWRAERFGAPFAPKNWGWVTFYHKVGLPEANEQEVDFLKCLAGLLELVVSRLDEASTDRGRQKAAGEAEEATPQDKSDTGAKEWGGEPPSESIVGTAADNGQQGGPYVPEIAAGKIPLDHAITTWIAARTERVRAGRIDFSVPLGSTPVVDVRAVSEVLNWGASNLDNGLPESGYLTLSVRGYDNRISIVFDRAGPSDGESDHGFRQSAAVMPVKSSVRETLNAWNATSVVINSVHGPRKFILGFCLETDPGVRDSSGKNVLVVDEEELIRDLLLGMLNMLGYRAWATTSVEEGLKRFFAGDFDTIITGGLGRPGNSADGFAERIKLYRPQTRIVLIRELGLEGSIEPSSQWVDATVAKPFRIDELRAALEPDSG